MTSFLLHLLAGSLGALAVQWLLMRLAGETRSSLPSGALLIGLNCGLLAHYLTPWATPAVLLLYAAAGLAEWRRERRAREAWRAGQDGAAGGDGDRGGPGAGTGA